MKERKVIKKSDNCWLVNLTVSFNVKNPREQKLLEQAEKLICASRWSGEIKRLFEQSIEGNMFISQLPIIDTTQQHDDSSDCQFDSVSSFI